MSRHKNAVEGADGEVVVQLATRVPKALYRELKLYSVTESRSISELVTTYIRDGLKGASKPRAGAAARAAKRRREAEEDAA
jgi:hypothetical protein